MRPRPSVLIIQDQQLLLLRYDYKGGTVYGIPGGNPDPGESLEQTLIRELREELQLTVKPGKLLLVAETIRPGKPEAHVLHCLFEGSISSGRPILNPAETTAAALEWIPLAELENYHLYPHLGKQIAQIPAAPQGTPVYRGMISQPWV